MQTPGADPFSRERLAALQRDEAARFCRLHPRSLQLALESAPHYLFGLPMHWMRDWPTPSPLYVQRAQGARLECVDGLAYADFCLGDTGAMFGHSPPAVARALAAQAQQGLTAMLPSALVPELGRLLAARFGLPRWQLALSASDANRFVLRWARAITGRRRVLVFDGCYHGTVDDTLADRAEDGRTLTRASLLGQVHDLAETTLVVPFNDPDAVRRALAAGDVACVLTEPALTNCGLVPPQPGFLEALRQACDAHGTLLVMDETHTLSTGPGGYCRVHGLDADFLVVGKAVAGGLPCAVYGFTDAVAARMEAARRAAPEGHSGIGTTLSAPLLGVAALHATLAELMTPETHAAMERGARALEAGLQGLIAGFALPWSVARLGARMELQFCDRPPADAAQARAAMDAGLERALHLWLLNRGVLLTPFHNMMLVSPLTGDEEIGRLLQGLRDFLGELLA
ncbi:transaminase [Caldimonas tepidiphila]|uniref:transaminase n=1 Tax=Caldimonas tepidiphila TaxID=2315841 RepID=UPI000E5C4CE9|nr:transaminase [Caldimonas tepidiphila]